MTRTAKTSPEGPEPISDRGLWHRCRTSEAPEDEASRFLDLAAFADGRLDADDKDRVAAWLSQDPEAAADVQAARSLSATNPTSAALEHVIARAAALAPDASPVHGQVVKLVPRQHRRLIQVFAQWGSLAAAMVVAGWLGFSMGSDASLALSDSHPASDTSLLPEIFDPASGLLRDLGEGLRT
jgi:anti-sigma factor RsiW